MLETSSPQDDAPLVQIFVMFIIIPEVTSIEKSCKSGNILRKRNRCVCTYEALHSRVALATYLLLSILTYLRKYIKSV